eukprot:gene9482-biopygen13616
MEVYEDFEMPGRATVSRNPYQAAMDDVMCSVFCERSVVYSASKTLFNLHYLSVTDELVPHDAMSSGRFYGGVNRILFPVIVKADPIMCEAAEPLHQFKISMMYDTGSTLSYMTLEVLHALGYKNAVYPPDPKLPHSEHICGMEMHGHAKKDADLENFRNSNPSLSHSLMMSTSNDTTASLSPIG